MKIKNIKIGLNYPPCIIAEISGNHNQSLEVALNLIDKIKEAGIKFVKIQTYTPDTITLNSNKKDFLINSKHSLWGKKKLYDLYKKAYTPWEWHKIIFKKCKELNLICFSSPFDETAVDFLEELSVPLYKIASFEVTHIPLIKKIAATKKPVILSTGMATIKEIRNAIKILESYGSKNYAILKCTSNYPASPKDSNILTVKDMRQKFKCEVGISDHTPGIGVALSSIAFGASIIEKHITLDRNNGAVDSKFSLEPDEFKLLNIETLRAWQSIGKIKYGPTKSEMPSLKHRRSIYLVNDLNKGDKIKKEDIKVVRPSTGLEPIYYEKIINKTVNRNLKKNSPLKKKYFNFFNKK